LPNNLGGYTVGVLVQSNFGGVLQVDGIQIGKKLSQYYLKDQLGDASADGSIMIVVATDAPLSDRNLKRLAKRGLAGLARTGASMSNGSGDYVIAFSTADDVRRTAELRSQVWAYPEVPNELMSPLFQAVIESTEEAIYNSLCMAETMTGHKEHTIYALPLKIFKK
jgi:D-aminopeptidase